MKHIRLVPSSRHGILVLTTALALASIILLASSCLPSNLAPNSSPTASAAITIEPAPGDFLRNTQNESSQVLLEEVMVSQGVATRQYAVWGPPDSVNVGDPMLVVTGIVLNQHPTNMHLAMWAQGFDGAGKQVCWTADAAHIMGQIGFSLAQDEQGYFIIHLNMAENVKSIRIFANNYAITPP